VSRLEARSLVDSARIIEAASSKVALRTNSSGDRRADEGAAGTRAGDHRAGLARRRSDRRVPLPPCGDHLFGAATAIATSRWWGRTSWRRGAAEFIASYRYEHDESWTRVDEMEARDRRRAEIQGFVSNRLLKE
jgi:hypothetical protein